jgi:UbiD family decarboxylase
MMRRSSIGSQFTDFIQRLWENDELTRVSDTVDWKFQIGQRTRDEQDSPHPKALLFENIKDYPGFSVLANALSTPSKIGLALGDARLKDFSRIAAEIKSRIKRPFSPILIDEPDPFDRVALGEYIDIKCLPVPWWHTGDGGRYLGTWHINVSKDVESGIRNVGIYRMMIIGPRRATISISPNSHLSRHIIASEARNQALEMAVAIGVNEAVIMSGAGALPYGVDEFGFAGSLLEQSLPLVKCQTIDMEVPSDCQIVIEGRILPGIRVPDGPFMDYAGKLSMDPSAHIFEMDCLRYRDHAVFRGSAIGKPGAEDHVLFSLLARLGFVDFHGNRIKRFIQQFLFKMRWYGILQASGRIGTFKPKNINKLDRSNKN